MLPGLVRVACRASPAHPVLRGFVPAGRAVSVVLEVLPGPGSELPADPGLEIMDPAPGPAIVRSPEERASPQFFSSRILPVPDTGDTGEVIAGEGTPADPFPVRKPDRDMLQDILPVLDDPRDDIFNNPLLAPSPPFAAAPALEAVLVLCQELFSCENVCPGSGYWFCCRVDPLQREQSGFGSLISSGLHMPPMYPGTRISRHYPSPIP